MINEKASVVDLDSLVQRLPEERRELFERLFRITITSGRLLPPPSMHKWIEGLFGSVEAVKDQRIVKVTNVVTLEESLFNELRARRPIEAREAAGLQQIIDESRNDHFCRPEQGTPEDVFGRIRGRHSITASNIAKYDGFHGVVIFQEHDPLRFSQEEVVDYLDTSLEWIKAAHATDASAVYPFIMWNCLWKSGASIVHGHFQVTLGRGFHYGKVENLRLLAIAYRERYGTNYFDDLWQVHQSLGLGLEWSGVRVYPYLAPIKEKETFLVGPNPSGSSPQEHAPSLCLPLHYVQGRGQGSGQAPSPAKGRSLDENLKVAIFRAANCFVKGLGVTSFNMAVYMPPLVDTGEDWEGFPIVVRLVDRGDPLNKTADVGAMELYAASVISSDPFRVAEALRAAGP